MTEYILPDYAMEDFSLESDLLWDYQIFMKMFEDIDRFKEIIDQVIKYKIEHESLQLCNNISWLVAIRKFIYNNKFTVLRSIDFDTVKNVVTVEKQYELMNRILIAFKHEPTEIAMKIASDVGGIKKVTHNDERYNYFFIMKRRLLLTEKQFLKEKLSHAK